MDRPRRAPQHNPITASPVDVSLKKLVAELKRLAVQRDSFQRERDAARAETAAATQARDEAAREREEFLAALQRERAEFLNFKRRTSEERVSMLGLAAEDLIRKVLALADDFDRAVETRPEAMDGDPWVEGIAAIDRKLRLLLESEGVTEIEARPGTKFDPREHEAVVNVPDTGQPDGEIVEELRRGYKLRDRVIRPALVAVASPSPAAADHETANQQDPNQPVH
ncbi:MAG TPA: nucleotide exchange factor GrpE [Candidatus Limnocylindrales bacterium]|nr:nucleotide exchange factor GrpE [Candidatus Limnocylindrales bacterium]